MQSSCAQRNNDDNNEVLWSASANAHSNKNCKSGSDGDNDICAATVNLNNDRLNQTEGHYNMNEINLKQMPPIGHGTGEDMRVTKLIRRLLNEESVPVSLELCKKLEVAVRIPSNVSYISRSLESLLEYMLSVLKHCPPACTAQMCDIFGLMAYIGRASFPSYECFIRTNYRNNKRLQKEIILTLKATMSYDKEKRELTVFSESIIQLLKELLENVENGETFIVITSATALFSRNYAYTFEAHFTDVIDIIIGWQLEAKESRQVREHCAYVLQEFSPFFNNKIDFTYGLLSQFTEDIVALSEEIISENPTKNVENENSGRPTKAVERFGSFVGAFNSLLKCLQRQQTHALWEPTIGRALEVVWNIFNQLLTLNRGRLTDTSNNVNELFCICLNGCVECINMACVQKLIEIQLAQITKFEESQQESILYLTLCFVHRLRANLPIDFVTLIFKQEQFEQQTQLQSYLTSVKLSVGSRGYLIFLRLQQEILLIKNVPLLQAAYKHLTHDIDESIAMIMARANNVTTQQQMEVETCLNFNISVLAALATQTSSIIGMYACNPSILDLLITNCQAANYKAWQYNPTLHSAILILLSAHCTTNRNYRATSRLLQTDNGSTLSDQHTSPTAENFTTILQFLARSLEQASCIVVENLKELLTWTMGLLRECRDSAPILLKNEHFQSICRSLSERVAQYAPLECSGCIEVLMSYRPQLPTQVLVSIRDTSLQQLDVLDQLVNTCYGNIYASLPLSVALQSRRTKRHWHDELTHAYRASRCYAPLRDKFFKLFLDAIQDVDSKEDRLPLLLKICFAERSMPESFVEKSVEKFLYYARNSYRLLSSWLQFEVARYLVEQKLRTAIGKPQETFLAIEAIIMRYARLMSSPLELSAGESAETTLMKSLRTQRNMRLLLGFLDALEKLVYNAAEGSAFAYMAPERPVRAFFRLNSSTCQSWFGRIRLGVIMLALHSMEPEAIIRYSEEMLLTLNPTDAQFNQSVVYITWALLCCNEPDSLEGMYAWVRSKTGKRYQWIQHAAEQAAGRKEAALEGYRTLLHEYELDNIVRQFIIAQLLDCLYHTGQWSNLKAFKQQLSGEDADCLNPFTQRKNTYISKMESLLARYDRAAFHNDELTKALHELTVWPESETGYAKQISESSACRLSQLHFEHALNNVCVEKLLLKANHGPEKPLTDYVANAINFSCREALLCNSTADRQRLDLTVLKHVMQEWSSEESACLIKPVSACIIGCNGSDPKRNGACHSSTLLIKCLGWQLLLEHLTKSSPALSTLYLDVAANARKEGNYKCCQTMLERFFMRRQYTTPLPDISAQLLNDRNYKLNTMDVELLRGYSEIAKWLYVQEKPCEVESINLGAALCLRIHEQVATTGASYPSISADMLLTLSEWLTLRSCNGVTINNAILQHLLVMLPELPLASTAQPIPEADRIIGRLINSSVLQAPTCEDAWVAFGNWCYRWGKKVVEARSNEKSSLLSAQDVAQIKLAIGEEAVQLDPDIIYQLVNTLNRHANDNAAEDIEANEHSTSTEVLKRELRAFKLLAQKPAEVIDRIIQIWRQANKSVYELYETATRAYFRYLSLKGQNGGTPAADRQHRYHVDDSNMVTTTLRLLRLIVKHALGLQEVFEEGLKTTPIQPWKVIIPQLFSRLNHHEPYVRKSVSDLLCRLAESRPHLVIFPAVVGANRELKSLEQQSRANESTTQLTNCFGTLLCQLAQQAPQTVAHVQLLVKELKRVCLLWDEYWLHSLAQIYTNYQTRVNALEAEYKPSDIEGRNRKFNSFREHIVADLKNVAAFTERPPETDYEHTFKVRFDAEIKCTIDELSVQRYPEAWERLKQLYTILQSNPIRGSLTTLSMSSLSPVLANMSNTVISMPGVDLNESEPIYIRAVESTVRILPTKTKPKKVAFLGSNGQKYTYLFKGLEDLHLDERIMQFLSISNSIMACKMDTPATTTCYKAHHYSVIPLGPQSGLISWVDGVTPLFTLYKKWQVRDAQLKAQQKPRHSETTIGEPVVPTKRLTELFFDKLTPLLAKHNLKVSDPRKQWPLSVLRQVLNELTRETPRDLLVRELWCHAINASEWRKSVRRYTMSLAVMSVIGYVIGLGDRHLDNVLINLAKGEIVHIDYNVCFEKGKSLRIPEKVPFRMTQNLVETLGITGVEGAFRLGCEYVLKAMRKERETLLTLLEAFVYDPLVDWTVGEDGAVTRRSNAAKALTIGTTMSASASTGTSATPTYGKAGSQDRYAISKRQDWEQACHSIGTKLAEVNSNWLQFFDKVETTLKFAQANIRDLLEMHSDMQILERQRDMLMKQSVYVGEIELLGSAMGSHSFNTAAQRYARKRSLAEALHRVYVAKQADYESVSRILELFGQVTQEPATLARLNGQLNKQKLLEHSWRNEYQLVAEVLPDSQQTLASYESARIKNDSLNECILVEMAEALAGLEQYAGIMYFYPMARKRANPLLSFMRTFGKYMQEQQQREQQEEEKQRTAKIIALSSDDLTTEGRASSSAASAAPAVAAPAYITALDDKVAVEHPRAAEVLERLDLMQNLYSDLINIETDLSILTCAPPPLPSPSSIENTLSAVQNYHIESHEKPALLNALAKAISSSVNVFTMFEIFPLNELDATLLLHQINYVEVVHRLTAAIMPEHPDSKAFAHFSNLRRLLQAIDNFRNIFLHELAEKVYKLFLFSKNPGVLNHLCAIGAHVLYDEYSTATAKTMSAVGVTSSPLTTAVMASPCMLEFFAFLGTVCEAFEQLQALLCQVLISARFSVQNCTHVELKNFLQTQILPNDPADLDCQSLFDVIHQCLLSADSYDMRAFTMPINNYIEYMERQFLLGLTPLFVNELACSLSFQQSDSVQEQDADVITAVDAEFGLLCEKLFVDHQMNAFAELQHGQRQCIDKWINLVQRVTSAYYWANEDLIKEVVYEPIIEKIVAFSSINFLTEGLEEVCKAIEVLQIELEQHVATLLKEKSNWNRNHIESFMRSEEAQRQLTCTHLELAKQLLDYLKAVQVVEHCGIEDRDNARADQLLATIDHWTAAYTRARQSSSATTSVEDATLEMLKPEGPLDAYWLSDIKELLDDQTYLVQRKLTQLECRHQAKQERIYMLQFELQHLLDSPHCVELRLVINLAAKWERQNAKQMLIVPDVQPLTVHLRDAQSMHKSFCSKLGEMRQILLTARGNNLSNSHIDELQSHMQGLLQGTCKEDLVAVLQSCSEKLQRWDECKTHSFEACASTRAAVNPCEQKRNAYGVSVWKKIRMKLEGREPDPNRRATVSEQVDYIIHEATNVDNLAVLYEGWTPWV